MNGAISTILLLWIRKNFLNKTKSFSKRRASLIVDGLEQVYIDLLFKVVISLVDHFLSCFL